MKQWNSDRWLSILAIVASLGTLFTIIYQTNIFRKQQYASVLPYLEMWNSWRGDSYRLVLINNGIGPAFVESIKIIYADSVYDMDPAVFVRDVVDDSIQYRYSNVYKGRLIPAGTDIELIAGADSINSMKLWSWFSRSDTSRVENPDVEIIYKSVYDERWKIQKNESEEPIKID